METPRLVTPHAGMILQPMSVPEYLRSEELSAFRREYVGGFAYPLHGNTADTAGTTAAHNLIGGNIAAALHGSCPCSVGVSFERGSCRSTDNSTLADVRLK